MTEHKRLVENIQTRLAFYVSNLRISNDRDYFDENKEAEYFFCKPLSLLFDADVTNINSEQRNFPGIDLADRKEGICFQITSTNTKKKVQHTLDEFLEHRLDQDFDRLIVLIVTAEAPPRCADLKFDRPFGFDAKRDVWNISRLVQEFENLPADQRHLLKAFSDYLDRELPSLEAPKPRLELPPSSSLGQDGGFVGREAELEEIRSRFARGAKLVVLTGLGGMGKTELAIHYGQSHPGRVYFARFDSSFTRTLANMASGIRPVLSEEQQRLDDGTLSRMVLALLEGSGENDLLIIDNADSETGSLADLQRDPGYAALAGLPLKLLLTTRSDTPRAVSVEPMPDAALIRIFQNHHAQLTEREMAELIRAVNSHTMTIDLIARTLNGKGWRNVTAADLLAALRENTLASRKYRKIATDYSQSPEQAQIYGHLSVVFDISGIPEEGKAVLRCAALLPEGGMDGECFGNSLPEDLQTALDALLDRGWLTARDGLLTIHPIIRLVCRTEIPPTDEYCAAFLGGLTGQYDPYDYRKDRYRQMAQLLTDASRLLADAAGECAMCAAVLWYALGEFRMALECDLRAMRKLEEVLPPDHPDLARSFNNVGGTFGRLGDHKQALEYKQKALAIREKALPPDHPDLAQSFNNVGGTFSHLGDHKQALEYLLKALAICEKALPPDHPNLATTCNNVGFTYGDLGDHKQALEYLLKALAIREKTLPPDHPDLAQSFNNVGGSFGRLGDHKQALEYQQKALAIREKALPPDHPDLAQSFNNVGGTFSHLGDHKQALEYLLKALAIWEKALPPDHPDLATTCNNVGSTFGDLGDHKKELEYQQKALAIRETVLPPDHPDLASSLNNVGFTYGRLGDNKQALEYLLKALAIREKALPPDHPDLARSCNNIACTYYAIGRLREAARYMRRAADIISRSCLPENHPDRVDYPNWADQLEKEAKMQQALMATMQEWGTGPFGLRPK